MRLCCKPLSSLLHQPISSVLKISVCLMMALSFFSCEKADEYDSSPVANFQTLWQILDERYCFFDYKAEVYNLDWYDVRRRYSKLVSEDMSQAGLFDVMARMLGELRDGHVNLISSFNVSHYNAFYLDYPHNFNSDLLQKTLGDYYRYVNGLYATILPDNIGYIYCGSFENSIGETALDEILQYVSFCHALIVDVRDNGGGSLDSSERLASRFTNSDLLTGYVCHKTGTGHSDFSDPEPVYLSAAVNHIRWQKSVAVLTNRRTFSAANDFVRCMRCTPQCVVVGDKSGGGSGLPMSQEMPNGWSVRFSACPTFDVDMEQTEFGIEPDVYATLTDADIFRGEDTILEKAREILNAPKEHKK